MKAGEDGGHGDSLFIFMELYGTGVWLACVNSTALEGSIIFFGEGCKDFLWIFYEQNEKGAKVCRVKLRVFVARARVLLGEGWIFFGNHILAPPPIFSC